MVGIIFGHVALHQLKTSGERGHGLALAAVIIGWSLTGIVVVVFGALTIGGMVSGGSAPF